MRLEKSLNRLFILLTIIFLAPSILPLFRVLYEDKFIFDVLIYQYFVGLYIISFSIYQSTALQFMRELYNHHRLAYNTHIKALVGLFLATELTLLFIIAVNLTVIFAISCYKVDLEIDEAATTDSICHAFL